MPTCPLVTPNGPADRGDQCLLIGVKQTQCGDAATSEFDPQANIPGIGTFSQGFAYSSALMTSIPTNGSLPSTHASCPGGMVYDIPGPIVILEPSLLWTFLWPDTAY